MTEHLSETVLEHYLLGGDDVDHVALEQHLLECDACASRVRGEIELELELGEVAKAATFCPGCSRVLGGDRCDACGATLVAGGYRIERVLVKTTHGRLYAAVDGHGNRVALKELAFVQAPTLESLAAFDRETKFLRALSHPCIPKFHGSFIEGTGIHTRMYIAQDLVEGESLLARMQHDWFDERAIVKVAQHVLEILIYLQSLSPMVFHRDVKPANLIARSDGTIALVDFGAARDVSETMGNTAVGTFGYMPLEQMAGIYDATTDTYALGASLFHLLTRREPWKLLDGGGAGINVSPELRRYLDRLMARRPQDRFPDARAALDALLAVRPGSRPLARKPTKRLAVLGLAALVVGGVGVGAVVATRASMDPARPAPAMPISPEPTPSASQDGKSQAGPTYPSEADRPTPMGRPTPQPRPRSSSAPTFADLIAPAMIAPRMTCPVYDRLPSGGCPPNRADHDSEAAQAATQWLTANRDLQAHLGRVDRSAVVELKHDIVAARAQVERHRRGVVVIGKVTIEGGAGSINRPLYFAVAASGAFELALHGYPRTKITPKVAADFDWVDDVVMSPLPTTKAATIAGTADASTQISAWILHEPAAAAVGPIEAIASRRATTIQVGAGARFEVSDFTPGRYRIEIASAGVET